jgi:hypothetical protein
MLHPIRALTFKLREEISLDFNELLELRDGQVVILRHKGELEVTDRLGGG